MQDTPNNASMGILAYGWSVLYPSLGPILSKRHQIAQTQALGQL